MSRAARRALVLVVALGCLLVPAAAAYALWSASASASVSFTTAPPPPAATTITGCTVSANKLDLTWSAVTGTGITYSLYYRPGTTGGYTAFATGLTTTSKTGIKKGDLAGSPKDIQVLVRAVNAGGESPDSNVKTVAFDNNTCS